MSCADGVRPCSGGRRSTHLAASSKTVLVKLFRLDVAPTLPTFVNSVMSPYGVERTADRSGTFCWRMLSVRTAFWIGNDSLTLRLEEIVEPGTVERGTAADG